MRWRRIPNLFITLLLTLALTVVTFLNIIGPLHMNATGNINPLSAVTAYSFIYWVISLILIWDLYFFLRKKPEVLFFTLIIVGILLIIIEVFIWAWLGS